MKKNNGTGLILMIRRLLCKHKWNNVWHGHETNYCGSMCEYCGKYRHGKVVDV